MEEERRENRYKADTEEKERITKKVERRKKKMIIGVVNEFIIMTRALREQM